MNIVNSIIALIFCTSFYMAIKLIAPSLRFKKIKRINLLENFYQKIFMTICLGSFFISLFLILNYLARHFIKKEILLNMFHYGIRNPESFFYLAGMLFATNTLLIYLVRLAIKRVYWRLEKPRKK